MLGDKNILNTNYVQKTSFMGQIQESKFNQLLQQKDKEINALKKTIKRLNKEVKQKTQSSNLPAASDGKNVHFKNVLQREMMRYNQLRQVVQSVTQRIKKLSQEINQEFSISQNSESMENLVKMLQMANMQGSRSGMSSLSSKQRFSKMQEDDIEVDQAFDEFQVIIRGLAFKYGQSNKMCKQSLQIKRHLQQQLDNYIKQLKIEKKSRDLLQKLLEKNQTQKNQLVNQINNIASKRQIQELRSKSKQQIILHFFKLTYRIKDLQKQKEDYIKSSTKDKQNQTKMYEALWNKVKGMKQRSRIGKSFA